MADPPPPLEATNGIVNPPGDVPMTDAPVQQPAFPYSSTPTPRTTTPIPLPHIPGFTAPATTTTSTSRATSVHPPEQQQQAPPPTMGATTVTTQSTTTIPMPSEAPLHGAPVRQYINSKITGVLLEGMKIVAREQPKDPLRVLGEYLLQRSKEIEQQEGQKGE
ncbi:hypothetical protein QBC40DRAFT_343214 [Triangularia verruculosa]|uniref:Uncharacterized protein n=1 Tax=Triangularia verruculosa TaxID=2587418 RepID=A0AAN7AQU0_9PEZI|nr:hypothetical protein QBC40DRAFT_343214 [Triangularia verruculosa]